MRISDWSSDVCSSDLVGKQLILAPGDLVAQLELLFLEPCELKLVGNRPFPQRDDRGVEVAMFDAKQFEALGDIFGVHAAVSATFTSRPQRAPGGRIGTTSPPIRDL